MVHRPPLHVDSEPIEKRAGMGCEEFGFGRALTMLSVHGTVFWIDHVGKYSAWRTESSKRRFSRLTFDTFTWTSSPRKTTSEG